MFCIATLVMTAIVFIETYLKDVVNSEIELQQKRKIQKTKMHSGQ